MRGGRLSPGFAPGMAPASAPVPAFPRRAWSVMTEGGIAGGLNHATKQRREQDCVSVCERILL